MLRSAPATLPNSMPGAHGADIATDRAPAKTLAAPPTAPVAARLLGVIEVGRDESGNGTLNGHEYSW